MNKKIVVIGAVAATAALVGGLALADSRGYGPGFGPSFMQGEGQHGMGPGMGQGMMQHMGGRMGPGMGQGMMRGHGRAAADPAQIETLKSELGITPAQEQAWNKYTKAFQDAATTMRTTREGVDPDSLSKLSPQDRYAFVTKMREQGQKQFETVKTAADELLATLDATQKAKAQEILPGLAFGPGPMRGAGMGGPQHRHQGQ